MCKHILNAQVSIRANCCKRWFDCPECHQEVADHPLRKSEEIVLACKKCKKVFRKNTSQEMDEADEYCPHCDNHYVLDAKVKEQKLFVEFEGSKDLLDKRMKLRSQILGLDDDDEQRIG